MDVGLAPGFLKRFAVSRCNAGRIGGMKHLAFALLLAAGAAHAVEAPEAVKKAASATAHGLQTAEKATARGLKAAASGVETGVKAASKGVNTAARKVGLPTGPAASKPKDLREQ
jgi:hypothetical protein